MDIKTLLGLILFALLGIAYLLYLIWYQIANQQAEVVNTLRLLEYRVVNTMNDELIGELKEINNYLHYLPGNVCDAWDDRLARIDREIHSGYGR